jgi:hypothetical protein
MRRRSVQSKGGTGSPTKANSQLIIFLGFLKQDAFIGCDEPEILKMFSEATRT